MKKILILLLSCMFLISCNSSGGGSDETSETSSGRLLHSFSDGDSVGHYYNSPTLVGDYLYIGNSRGFLYEVSIDNSFYKLNRDLTKVWEYNLGSNEVRGGAALDSNGNIYFVVEEGRVKGDASGSQLFLYSLRNDGEFRWYKLLTSAVDNMGMSNPAIGKDDTIYIGGDQFYALNPDGTEKWNYGTDMQIMNAPIIDPDGNIYFNSATSVVSLDSGGNERWSFSVTGESYSSPAFSVNYAKIYVGVGDTVYCLDSSSGGKIWEYTPSGIVGTFRATPAVDNNNNIYFGTKADQDSVFYAIKSDGSGLLWKKEIGADLYSSPALGDNNTIYVGSEYADGQNFHALDMKTGDTKWSLSSMEADVTWSSPALSDSGILYFASMDYKGEGGKVYAFQTDSTGLLPNSGSPRFHEGNANTGRRN